jgi:hypothetical protein
VATVRGEKKAKCTSARCVSTLVGESPRKGTKWQKIERPIAAKTLGAN